MEAIEVTHRHTRSKGTLLYGIDVLEGLKQIPDESVQLVCTSPPFFGLRDYGQTGDDRQVGREPFWPLYVKRLVEIFREIMRVLRPDGVVFLNIGDTYCNYRGSKGGMVVPETIHNGKTHDQPVNGGAGHRQNRQPHLKEKDMGLIPWRVAEALQKDGWYLRSEITWVKPHCKPESVKDRFSRRTEPIFMLTKFSHYAFDKSVLSDDGKDERGQKAFGLLWNVWVIPPASGGGEHRAVWPEKLVEPMVLAASKEGDTVLDPFSGSATTGKVALRNRRNYIGIDLLQKYLNDAIVKLEGETKQQVPVTGPKTDLEELWG